LFKRLEFEPLAAHFQALWKVKGMYQGTSNREESVTTDSSQVMPNITGGLQRTQLIITNTSATATITLAKGENAAVANIGIILRPGVSYYESTDGGYICWQGTIQAVGDASGTLSIVEGFKQVNY